MKIIFPALLSKKRFWVIIASIVFLFPVVLILIPVARDTYFSKAYYQGGYAPDGEYCDYGYNRALKACCDEDDYSCEICDLHGIYCDYKDIFQGEYYDIKHIEVRAPKGDYDCVNFKSWDEAQKVFIREGGPKEDPYHLDEDLDGKACETFLEKH